MSNDTYLVRICKTWAGYTAAEIVASAKLETCGAGSVEIMPTLPRLNGGIAGVQSGYLMHLTDSGHMLIENFDGALCRMVLNDADLDTLRGLTERAEAKMLASYGPA